MAATPQRAGSRCYLFFEQYNGVLLYPTLYEAEECSKNCFYTGAVPNQQLDDFVPWIINTLGRKKFYLIGANYIYPKETNREVKALLQKHGGTTVAEEYSPLGSTSSRPTSTRSPQVVATSCSPTWSAIRSSPFTNNTKNSALLQGHPDLHANHYRTRDCRDGTGERLGSLHLV